MCGFVEIRAKLIYYIILSIASELNKHNTEFSNVTRRNGQELTNNVRQAYTVIYIYLKKERTNKLTEERVQ